VIVNGGTTTMGNLTIGSTNSSATFSMTGGSLIISGTFSLAPGTASNRPSFAQVTGGTLTSPNPMLISAAANQIGTLSIAGGTTSLPGISMFQGGASGANATVTVGGASGGALYIDSSGIQADFSSGTSTGSVVMAVGGGTLGATADWSSNVPFAVTDTTGLTSIKAADASNVPHNITLTGAVTGVGNLVKTGGGTLTLSSSNSTFTGGTIIKAGTLLTTAAAVPATAINGTTTNTSTSIVLDTAAGLFVGQSVTGAGIPAGATITAVDTGANTITLSAAATQDGTGSLTFGAHSALGNGPLTMAGGTLNTGGFSQLLTTLKVKANSALDLGTGNTGETLAFGNSSLIHWNFSTNADPRKLNILDWTGTGSDSDLDQIIFPSATSLNPNQLSQIEFNGAGFAKLRQITSGTNAGQFELVPSATAPVGILTLGDINQDGVVNTKDISAMMSALTDLTDYQNGTSSVRSTGGAWNQSQLVYVADVNLDGVVDNRDTQALTSYIANGLTGGGGGSLTAVPEPASLVLWAAGGVVVVGCGYCGKRRRRSN
jgi:autotransporter-associated beta strand protein